MDHRTFIQKKNEWPTSIFNSISQRAICIRRIIFKRNQIVELFDETTFFLFLFKWNNCPDFVREKKTLTRFEVKIFLSDAE